MTEEDQPHDEFTHQLAARWEAIAQEAQSDKTRVCLLRTGLVLSPNGGLLAKILPIFKWALAGRLVKENSICRGSILTIW